MLKVGRLSVVAHLDSLPATQHDPASYVVDVNHLSVSFPWLLHAVWPQPMSRVKILLNITKCPYPLFLSGCHAELHCQWSL